MAQLIHLFLVGRRSEGVQAQRGEVRGILRGLQRRDAIHPNLLPESRRS